MNRKRVIAIVVSACMLLGTGAVFVSRAEAQGDASPRAERHAQGGRARAERHPEIRHAMRALENAKKFLQKADRDFGGHRTNAVKDVDQALSECKQALAYDKD